MQYESRNPRTETKVYLVNFGLRLQFSEFAEIIAVKILLPLFFKFSKASFNAPTSLFLPFSNLDANLALLHTEYSS